MTSTDELTEILQKELAQLEAELERSVEDWDFTTAAAYKPSIINLRERLRILNNLARPGYDDLERVRRAIQACDRELRDDNTEEWLRPVFRSQRDEAQRELQLLSEQSASFHLDGVELIDCLEKVAAGEVPRFELEIHGADWRFVYAMEDADLILRIETTEGEPLAHLLRLNKDRELRRMGFHLAGDSAVLTLRGFTASDIGKAVQLTARITYDVFHLYGGRTGKITLPPTGVRPTH